MPKIPDLKVWIYEPQYIIRKCWAPALMSQLTNTPTLMPGDLLVSELLAVSLKLISGKKTLL